MTGYSCRANCLRFVLNKLLTRHIHDYDDFTCDGEGKKVGFTPPSKPFYLRFLPLPSTQLLATTNL